MVKTRLNLNELETGHEIPPLQVKLDAQQYRKYNRLIKEINPIHFNKKYAQKLGYDDIVVAGNFLFTYIPRWIIDWTGAVDILKKIDVKFKNPAYVDDEIIHQGTVDYVKEQENEIQVTCSYEVRKLTGELTSMGSIELASIY